MAAGDDRQRTIAAQGAGGFVLLLIIVADSVQQQLLFFAAGVSGLAGDQLARAQEGDRAKYGAGGAVALRQNKGGMAGAGHHRGFQKGQNIAGFIQRRHRIVVARQYHQLAAGLLKLNHKAVIQLASVAWRRAGIKDVAGDNNGIDLVRLRAGQQPVEKGRVFGGAALAVKILAKVPVRGVDDAHKYSLAKKHRRIIYLSSRRLPL